MLGCWQIPTEFQDLIHTIPTATLAAEANFGIKLLIDLRYLKAQIRSQMPD